VKVWYKVTVYSDNPRLDNLDMEVSVGTKVTCKLSKIQPLCQNATYDERVWYEKELKGNLWTETI